jgi:hypothetical protein
MRVGSGRFAGLSLVLLLGAFFAVLSVGAASHAGAAPDTSTTDIGQSELDQCLGTAPVAADLPPTCTFDSNGNLISRSSSEPEGTGSAPNILPFLFLALIWSAVPFLIAVSIARSRDEPVSTAVLLTLVLGWIGLLIVVYGQRRAAGDVGLLMHSAPTGTPMRTAPVSDTSAARSVRERLQTIEDLYAQGVISTVERDSRRAVIVDQL